MEIADMRLRTLCQALLFCFLATVGRSADGERTDLLKAMVLTGQNNHGWQVLSSHYKSILEETARASPS